MVSAVGVWSVRDDAGRTFRVEARGGARESNGVEGAEDTWRLSRRRNCRL